MRALLPPRQRDRPGWNLDDSRNVALDMACFARSALMVAVVALAACSPASGPAAGAGLTSSSRADAGTAPTRPTMSATTSGSPRARTTSTTPATPQANRATGEVSITTQSYVACPQIGPSPKSDCGFLPLAKVPIDGADPISVRTGDDATVRVSVPAGAVVVTGTAVAKYAWTPESVVVRVSSGETEAILLTYGHGPQVPPPPR
jgi:hypothetical protein